MQNVPLFSFTGGETSKRRDEEKERARGKKSPSAGRGKIVVYVGTFFGQARDANDVTERGTHVCALSQHFSTREFSFLL